MKILDLSLTHHWYDEIHDGKKPEEYRTDKPFYKQRLMDGYHKYQCPKQKCGTCMARYVGECNPQYYDAIRFHRGQGGKTTMLIEFKGWRYGYGNTEWGAPADEEVHILALGRILSDTSGGPDSS